MRGLRTISAILWTPASLDAQQHTPLHLIGAVKLAVQLLCFKDQIRQGRSVNRFDLIKRPIVAQGFRYRMRLQSMRSQAFILSASIFVSEENQGNPYAVRRQ